MEDLIPLLIFAIISALSGLANRKKGKEEELDPEIIEQLEREAEEAVSRQNTLVPPPVPLAGSAQGESQEPTRQPAATRMPSRSSREMPPELETRSFRDEVPQSQDFQPDTRVIDEVAEKQRQLEEARRRKQLATKKLAEAKALAAKKLNERHYGLGREISDVSSKDLFSDAEMIRKGFITSLVFDKPVSLKDPRED